MERQGKVEIAGFVSWLPLFKLVVTKILLLRQGALSLLKALQALTVKKDLAAPACAFPGSVLRCVRGLPTIVMTLQCSLDPLVLTPTLGL